MTYTPTNRPVPSDAPEDLYFNSDRLDLLINGPASPVVDRNGVPRKSWAQIEAENASLAGDLLEPDGTDHVRYGNRLLTQKLGDIPSLEDYGTSAVDGVTNNQDRWVAAAAANQGGAVWVPFKTFLSDQSIPGFHNVAWFGPGSLRRGATVFHISQLPTTSNALYVAPSGIIGQDGLTPGFPIVGLAESFSVLPKYGPVLQGSWSVNLAAGTYPGGETFPIYLRGKERIILRGPAAGTPNVPTAVFDGGGVRSFGLVINGGNNILVQDIKYQNYRDFGINSQDLNDVFFNNVHYENIAGGRGLGFHFQEGRIRVYGGKATNCSVAGGSLISQCTVSMSSLTADAAGGFQIENCPTGIAAQEQVTGHIDYVTITGGVTGIDLVIQSRINSSGCTITGQTNACVQSRLGESLWLDNANNTLTPGPGGVRAKFYGGGGEINELNATVQERRVVFDSTAVSHTGTTTATEVKSYPALIDANSFDWNGRRLRVSVRGNFTGGSGTKTLTFRLGGNLIFGLTSIVSSTGFFVFDGILNAVDGANQRYSAFMLDTAAQNAPVSPCKGDVGVRTYNFNTGSDLALTVNAQLANAADGVTIQTVEIWETA
jgi:hypothetical protein